MNNGIKNILILGFGIAIGAVSGIALMRKKIEDEYEVIIQEEIASIKARFDKKKEKLAQDIKDLEEDMNGEVSAASMTTVTKDEEKVGKRYRGIVKNAGYSNREDNDSSEEEAEGDVSEEEYRCEQKSRAANSRVGMSNEPYPISEEAFYEECNHFDKITLSFYEDDEVLTEDDEEVIEDKTRIVGDCLERFGELSSDPEVVYVRNEYLQIDYEVIRLSKPYYGTVVAYEKDYE